MDELIEKSVKLTSEIGVLYGEARILILNDQLVEAAVRLDRIGAAYLEYADLLRKAAIKKLEGNLNG